MRTPALLSVSLAAAACLTGLAFASRGSLTAEAAAPASVAAPADEALEDAMYELKAHLKKLSRSLTPDTQEEALKHVTEMQRIAFELKDDDAPHADEVPEGERDAYRTAYRKEMLNMIGELVAIELDVLDGKHDKAMERVRGPLLEIRDRSHDKFQDH